MSCALLLVINDVVVLCGTLDFVYFHCRRVQCTKGLAPAGTNKRICVKGKAWLDASELSVKLKCNPFLQAGG